MNRKLWENLVSIYSVNVINYILPLFTLPFLAHVLGPSFWGKLAFAEGYANYVSLFVEYGFGLSATREVARAREDVEVRSNQLTSVLLGQVLLGMCALLITLSAVAFVPQIAPYVSLLPIAFVLALARSLAPFWYFQGLERLRLVAILNVTVNLTAAGTMLLCVRHPSDYWVPLTLRAGAAIAACLVGLTIAWRETPFAKPSVSTAFYGLRDGFSLFLFKSAIGLYTSGNVLLLGLMAPATAVAWFAGAEKIVRASLSTLDPITQTFYPRITSLLKEQPGRAMAAARLSLYLSLGTGLAAGLIVLFGAPLLVHFLLGKSFEKSIPVLRIFALLPPISAIGMVLGVQWMLPLRLDWTYIRIVLFAGVVNIVLAFLFVPHFREIGMVVSVIIAETFVTTGVVFALLRRNMDPWRPVLFQECDLRADSNSMQSEPGVALTSSEEAHRITVDGLN